MDKQSKQGELKSIDVDRKEITAHVSTFEWDRYDERFEKGAWDLDNFKKNPQVLWNHMKGSSGGMFGGGVPVLPIAKAIHIEEDDKGLISTMQFNKEDEFSMKVFNLYQKGFMKSFSVGFMPDFDTAKFEPIVDTNRKGLVWTKAELYEYSAVPIPANPGATIDNEMKECITKVFHDASFVTKEGGFEFVSLPELHGEVESGDLIVGLKHLINMSKMLKKEGLNEQKLGLISTSIDILKENLIPAYEKNGMTKDELAELRDIVEKAGNLLKKQYPNVNDLVSKCLLQVTHALKSKTV